MTRKVGTQTRKNYRVKTERNLNTNDKLSTNGYDSVARTHRYSQRVRKQFQPFTIPLSGSPITRPHARSQISTVRKVVKRKKALHVLEKTGKNDAQGKECVIAQKQKLYDKKRRRKNDLLLERSSIENFITNPILEKPPQFVSVTSYSRIAAHLAVTQNDLKWLERIIHDKTHFNVDALKWSFSYDNKNTAETIAVLSEDLNLIKKILDISKKGGYAHAISEPVLLSEQSCGQMNVHMLGHATANIQMARGGREGLNALLWYEHRQSNLSTQIERFISHNVSFEVLNFLGQELNITNIFVKGIYRAVRHGHRKLAGYLIKAFASYNFNDLHIETLLNDKQPLKKFVRISVAKKGRCNRDITPLHTAAINPNVNYLKELLTAEPQRGLDLDGWSVIHYAAACEGSAPLEHLLDIGQSPLLVTKKKQTPLHCAARAGRSQNVKILVNALQKLAQQTVDEQTNDVEPAPKRKKKDTKVALVNAKAALGKTALHFAAKRGHLKVVIELLNAENIAVDSQTSASNKKLTPLMLACQRGHRDVADLLIDVGGAVIEKGDKLKKTALTHAVINGQAHIAAMLLRRGASPLKKDTSGNTVAHYAAAYGWIDCLELSAKADPTCLTMSNDWHLTPLAVAYLKGHYGMMEWLVDGPYSDIVSVNCRDQSGTTLISSVIKSYSCLTDRNILRQLNFLTGKGADCSLKDSSLNSPLHYFCMLTYKLKDENAKEEEVSAQINEQRLTRDEYYRCVQCILDAGADLKDKNDAGEDALKLALKTGSLLLSDYILRKLIGVNDSLSAVDGVISDTSTKSGNILHTLIELPFQVLKNNSVWSRPSGPSGGQYNIIPMLNFMIERDPERVKKWLWERDVSERTPLLLLCANYSKARAEGSFLSTMCVVVGRIVSFDPAVLLQSVIKSKKDKKMQSESINSALDGAAQDSELSRDIKRGVMFYAMAGNNRFKRSVLDVVIDGKEYGICNKLLVIILDLAKEHDLLHRLLDELDENGSTPLLCAVIAGDDSTAIYLLRLSHTIPSQLNFRADATVAEKKIYDKETKKYVPWCKTLLMFAVEKEMLHMIKELDLSADQWNACDYQGNNAFHYAAQNSSYKSIQIFEHLKHKGVEIKANRRGLYPLHMAVDSLFGNDVDIFTRPVEWFIRNGTGIHCRDGRGCLPLHYAFANIADSGERPFASRTVDPIAVVSVLISAMDKKMLNVADKDGRTPLHYAAECGGNICIVTLIQAGADIHVVDNDGNTALALAVINRHQPCALSLIQAKSDVLRQVCLHTDNNIETEKAWIWIPRRRSHKKVMEKCSISDLIVRNEWQGIIYVLLNFLGKNLLTVGSLLRASLQHRKYFLAQSLMETYRNLINPGSPEDMKALKDLDLFFVYVANLASNAMDECMIKVFEGLLSMGCKWYDESDTNVLTSRTVQHLARNGLFECLKILHEADKKSSSPNWNIVQYSTGNENPLVGLIETWITNGRGDDDIKYWLSEFGKKFGFSTLMSYQRPAFDGMEQCLPRQPDIEYCKMTPLIRAIQCRCITLITYLMTEEDFKVDINQADENGVTPLMHACIINSEEIIQLLFNPNASAEETKIVDTQSKKENTGIGGLFGGFGTYADVVELPAVQSPTSSASRVSVTRKRKKKFLLKSKLDIYKECMGKNFLHFMVEPCGWENVGMLQDLCRDIPQVVKLITGTDYSPMTAAVTGCQQRMLNAMKKITNTKANIPVNLPFTDVSMIKTRYNIDEDCASYLKRDAERRIEKTRAERAKCLLMPHEKSGYQDSGELCIKSLDNDIRIPYKVFLSKTDVSHGYHGFHNFYRMELLKRKGSELYILFTNWGRIGDSVGQYQRTPFSSLNEADSEFCAIFKSKTGNDFENIVSFSEKHGKYRLLELDADKVGDIADLQINLEPVPVQLSSRPPLYRLIRDISNVSRLQERTRTVCSYTRSRIPFGCLPHQDIIQARKILSELMLLVKEKETVLTSNKGPDALLHVLRKQSEATNEFYRHMPLGGFENGSLPVIDNVKVIRDFEQVIENFLQMEIAGRLIVAAAQNISVVDPYVYIYDALECELTLLDPDDLMVQRILQNIQNSSCRCVRGIYCVKSKSPSEAFNENALEIGDHRLLWHGTRPENLLSILKVGLLACPPSSILTGQAFGKGIYFADVFSKSEAYCTASNDGMKFALLCEVALGKIHYYGQHLRYAPTEDLDKLSEFDTIKVFGCQAPNPLYNLTLNNGCTLSLGTVKSVDMDHIYSLCNFRPYLDYNEYVVRDITHTLVRYLVVFR